MKEEAIAVAAEDERNVERLGIAKGLLHSCADGVVVVLGLDDREGNVGLVVEDVVHPLLRAASVNFSPHIDAAIGEADFFANLGVEIPSRRHEAGCDKLGADVAFAE